MSHREEMHTKEELPNIAKIFPDEEFPYFFKDLYKYQTENNFTEVYGMGLDTIKVIEDFFTKDDIEECMRFIGQYKVMDYRDHWYPLHMADDFDVESADGQEYFNYTRRLGERMIKKASEVWDAKMSNLDNRRGMLTVHPTGSYLVPHTDILDIEYKTNDPHRDEGPTLEEQLEKYPNLWSGHLAVLGYLNDDYEGGELYFPQYDYYIKPKAGSLVMFPGGLNCVHGVAKIKSGIRYTVSQWIKFDLY